MALVGNRDTKPELLVRSGLHRLGLRFRIHVKGLPGHPDIVLKKHRAVVFVHGCFWHGHKDRACKLARTPKSNVEFWRKKVAGNQKRDQRVHRELKNLGWRVFIIWECKVPHQGEFAALAEEISIDE